MSSHFTAMVTALQKRQSPFQPSNVLGAVNKEVSRTESIRALLRDSGPLTSRQIAVTLGLDRESLVGALLKADLHAGRAYFRAGRYHWDHDRNDDLQREIAGAICLLRKHGYRVERISA